MAIIRLLAEPYGLLPLASSIPGTCYGNATLVLPLDVRVDEGLDGLRVDLVATLQRAPGR